MVKQVQMTEVAYNSYIVVFDNYMEPAGYYCPTIEETQKMEQNLSKYFLFLMWVEETGSENEYNTSDRKYIRDLLKKKLYISK